MNSTISFYLPDSPMIIRDRLLSLGCSKQHVFQNINKYYFLLHTLYIKTQIYKNKRVYLHSDLMRSILGGDYKTIINNLKKLRFIYLSSNYSTILNRSNGYSLMEGLEFKKFEFEVKGFFLNKVSNIRIKPIDINTELKSRIFNTMGKLKFDSIDPTKLDERELNQINEIKNNPFQVEGLKGKRLYNNFTNLSRNLRKQVRLNGERLVFVDIVNSQPVFLCSVIKHYLEDNKIEIEVSTNEFFDLCSSGSLYEEMIVLTGKGRDKVKNMIMVLLFGKNSFSNPVKEIFEKKFPQIMETIIDLKKSDYSRLSHLMQQKESDLLFNCVSSIPSNLDVLTIHDSIYTNESNLDCIKDFLLTTFRKFGLDATINVNDSQKVCTNPKQDNLFPTQLEVTPKNELDKRIINQYNLDVNKFINDFNSTSDLGMKYCIIKKYDSHFKKQDDMFDSRFRKMYNGYYSAYSFENILNNINRKLMISNNS